ncbi:MAG: Crp/Fnr family transcriptional regulator [Bacteroidia bacterium]|nr:Crp/Fnr family transcriptional regulator [Bacteroidia bacterium]
MSLENIKQFVYSFVPMTNEEWDDFEGRVHIKKVRAGDFILEQSEICLHVGFVNKGAARVYYMVNGEEINAHFAFENLFVCDYQSFLTQQPSKYFIQAMEDTEMVMIDRETTEYGFGKYHNWEKFGRLIAEYYYILIEKRTESFLFKTAEQRYLEVVESFPDIFERVPLYHIASYLGIKGPSLSRIRRRLVGKKKEKPAKVKQVTLKRIA